MKESPTTALVVWLKGVAEPWTGLVQAPPAQAEASLVQASLTDKLAYFDLVEDETLESQSTRIYFSGPNLAGWQVSGDGLPDEPRLEPPRR